MCVQDFRGCVQVLGSPYHSPSACETRLLWGLRGFTRQPENSKRAHFRAPALQTPPFGAPPFGLRPSGHHLSGPPFMHKPETAKNRSGPKVVWAKTGLGQKWSTKSGRANERAKVVFAELQRHLPKSPRVQCVSEKQSK